MFERLRQGLTDALIKTGVVDEPYDASKLVHYHWRCVCGGHSQSGGWLFESDAEYAAQRHQWNKGIDHPLPETYSSDDS